MPWHPQILADQLTLSQPGRQIMPTSLLLAPPDFQTFRRPCAVQCAVVHGVQLSSTLKSYYHLGMYAIPKVF